MCCRVRRLVPVITPATIRRTVRADTPSSFGNYHERPALVLMADRFADSCLATVTDPGLHAPPLVGAVDQVVDSTDVLSTATVYGRLASLYGRRRCRGRRGHEISAIGS
jgi:hypothetical protein